MINLRQWLADTEESRDYIEQQYSRLQQRYKNLKQDNKKLQGKLIFVRH
ncbi:MAG: hypothetical protein ACQJCO_08290 [cyanobacterium endosymbiont of Rhopalodia sterrenbergii]